MYRLLWLLLVLNCLPAYAFELVFAYGAGNGAPFSIIKDGKLESGLFKDIGQALAHELGVKVRFRHSPHKRTSLLLSDGTINSICMTHPDWLEGSQFLIWSEKTMEDYDHLVMLDSDTRNITHYSDLHGMNIGAMTGYIYFPEFMATFAKGHATRRDMNSLDALYSSLKAKRIDAVVDSLISVKYRQKINPDFRRLKISDLAVYRYDLYCAFNRSLKSKAPLINRAIRRMIEQGAFKKILESYQ